MLTLPTRHPQRVMVIAAARAVVIAAFPGFGPKSRDVGGAEARLGVGYADIVRIATKLSSRLVS